MLKIRNSSRLKSICNSRSYPRGPSRLAPNLKHLQTPVYGVQLFYFPHFTSETYYHCGEIRGYSRSLDYWKHPLPQAQALWSGSVSYFHFLTYDSIYRTTATCCDQDVFSCLKMPMFAPSLPTPSNCKYADLASQSQLMLVKDHRICTWTHITSLSHLFRVDVITDHHRGAVTLPCYALGNLQPCSPSFSRSIP